MQHRKGFLILFLISLSYSTITAQFAITGSVQGQNTSALEGANITILGYNLSTRSNSQGNFEFKVSSSGNYTLVAVLPGYLESRVNVFVDSLSRIGKVTIGGF